MNNKQITNTYLPLMNKKHCSLGKQQGVVLVVSLVFLVALTAVAAALMQNTTTDMKMSGATNEKVVATQAAISAVDEIIDNQVNIRAVNVFSQGLINFDGTGYTSAELLGTTKTEATASASVINNPFFDDLNCPRAIVGNSTGTIECNIIELRVQRPYGRENTSNVVVSAKIVQQLTGN
jgi:hypothetical protein